MIVYADKYGDSKDFAHPLINAVSDLKNGDVLSFENKEYHFYKEKCQSRVIHMTNTDSFKNPNKYFAVLIENLNDITIDGNGATFVVHGDICSVALLNCKNVVFKNITVKYSNPQDQELKLVKKQGRACVFKLPPTAQFDVKGKDIYFYHKSPLNSQIYWQYKNQENTYCNVLHRGDTVMRVNPNKTPFSYVLSAKKLDNYQVKIKYLFPRKFQIGDVYAVSQNANRNTCGILFNECENVHSQNIRVMYLQGFGWLSQMCSNMSFDKLTFIADENHVVTSFADLIHICGCKGNVKISNSFFAHAHDDAINIHGSFLRFKSKIDNNTAVFQFVHKQQGGHKAFFEGDKAQLYYRTNLAQIGSQLTVSKVADDIDSKTVTVTFKEQLPKEITAKYLSQSNIVCENVTYSPSVDIHNCIFESIPTRGILCTTSNHINIYNNKFQNLNMAHIFVSNDAADWYESGPVKSMNIFNNHFDLTAPNEKDNSALLVLPITLNKSNKDFVHKNISFYNNTVITGKNSVVVANCVDNLSVSNNKIIGKENYVYNNCKLK